MLDVSKMFRLESYITPILWSYFSKYVKNFNSHDFQVSLWEGGAVFSNLELNLDVLDSELQMPLSFASGHIQELKITVPWRKITSEPIVLNVNSMELVLKARDVNSGVRRNSNSSNQQKGGDPNADKNSGYMHSIITKIVSNLRVSFENVVIKYIEDDIAFSVNVGEASMSAADENWKTTFLDRIVYAPDFVLRKKLSFSDVNICLDRCNNAGVVDKFQDPMLYRCDFDVRIVQKFATTYSRVPYFYRMDLFLGHLQFCVTDEQIPMLVRMYNLFTWLMESGNMETTENGRKSSAEKPNDITSMEPNTDTVVEVEHEGSTEAIDPSASNNTAEDNSWTSWAAGWLYSLPMAVFGEDEEDLNAIEQPDDSTETEKSNPTITELDAPPPTPPPMPPSPVPENVPDSQPLPPPTTHFGVYINTLTIIFKAVKRVCDKPVLQRRIINTFPFLKCSIQGVVCHFIARGNQNSHTLGVSSIMVDGLGFCPCGVQDTQSSESLLPAQGGQCYFEAGKINSDFAASSFFQTIEELSVEWDYDINPRQYLESAEESKLLEKTPAFVLRYIVTRQEINQTELNNAEISEVIYHAVAAPCKILVCSGLIHRLKMIYGGINNYVYEPYGHTAPTNEIKIDLGDVSKPPATTYRLVIGQPLIEVFAADHPSDFSPEKRAQYFRKSGGIVPPIVLPRLTPEWPRMVISWDLMECTVEDLGGDFGQFKNHILNQPSSEQCRQFYKPNSERSLQELEDSSKTSSLVFYISEMLLTFVSEPMEINLGAKAATMHLTLTSDYDFQIGGTINFDSVTCSSRLEKRSNILWMPFSATVASKVHWQSDLMSSITEIDINSFNLFIGPETLITVSQLMEKLSAYIGEFIPKTFTRNPKASSNTVPIILSPKPKFVDDFQSAALPYNAGICPASKSILWQYPQKRTLTNCSINSFTFSEFHTKSAELKFEVEYFEEFTNQFHYFSSFKLCDGASVSMQFQNHLENNVISSTIWRIRVHNKKSRHATPILESLMKCLVIESIHIPQTSIKISVPEILLNLVNNTNYSGKNVNIPSLRLYGGNMDGVCPADHIVAALHLKEFNCYFTSIKGITKYNIDFTVDVKVLDYESVVLESLIESVPMRMELFMPEDEGPYSLSGATGNINLKIGASLVHTVMYSSALWNQIISSFDNQNFKMTADEKQTKIILNRILVSNDLHEDIQLRCTDLESFGPETVSSKHCKAVSFPSNNSSGTCESYLYLSLPSKSASEVKVDIRKTGYTSHQLDGMFIFANVSNISTSQKLVKISGPLIIANGLDRPVEVSIAQQSQTNTTKIVIPNRDSCPTLSCSLEDVEHFRFRFVSKESQQPWSSVVSPYLGCETEKEEVVYTQVKLLSHINGTIKESTIWITKIMEDVQGIQRQLIILLPYYYVRSWLSSQMIVHLSTAGNKNVGSYTVPGKGTELELQAVAEPAKQYQMTFQSNDKIPPSQQAVQVSAVSTVFTCKKIKSIDDILVQLTSSVGKINKNGAGALAWPFVDEDILLHEWNNEINPETEILVSHVPWIDGLPTIVADIRPWALFINLTGTDILFAQDNSNQKEEWDQYWVPYKCVFSPKRIDIPSGKFRIGLMMNDFLVKSPQLQFSEQPERQSVKKINKDCKVPIDCYSRLDLFGGNQIACLTIETRVRGNILIFIVRPTYAIQNRTPMKLFANGVTISSAVPQRRESWSNERLSMHCTLEPCVTDLFLSDAKQDAVPILHFTTDGQNYSASTPAYKYLALSCGGPWWFTQLVDYSEDQAEQMNSNGLPGSVQSVSIPKLDCTMLSPLNRHKLRDINVSTESLVVGSYTKNGQVWISIGEDIAPQYTIHNKSKIPIFYAEKEQKELSPRLHAPCFQQYLMVPPNTRSHFNLGAAYSSFPKLNRRETPVPDMLLAEVSQDLVDFVTSHHAQGLLSLDTRHLYSNNNNDIYPSGNLLFPDFDIDWQHILNINNNPTQYAKLSNQSVKISVEIVGHIYHIFVEDTKMKEVSAKAVRHGFANPRISENISKDPLHIHNALLAKASMTRKNSNSVRSFNTKDSGSDRFSISSIGLNDKDDEIPPSPPPEIVDTINIRPWKVKLHIPELYIAIQDDLGGNGKLDREFLGVTFEPILFEQVPLMEDSRLRPIECPQRQSWIYTFRVGSLQVDTPRVKGQLPCEFVVILEPCNRSEKIPSTIEKSSFAVQKFLSSVQQPSIFNIDSTMTLTRVSPDEVNLETVWLKVLPFSIYIEDRLLLYVVPSLQDIVNVYNEGYITLEKTYTSSSGSSKGSSSVAADSGITTHISILDSYIDNRYLEHDSGFLVPARKLTPGNQSSLLSRSISFDPTPLSSSSGLNSSNSSIISSLSHLRLASVSPPPPSPMMHLEPHGYNSRLSTRSILEIATANAVTDSTSEGQEDDTKDAFLVHKVKIPCELAKLFNQLSRPVRLKKMDIQATELELTLRTEKVLYLSLDRSIVQYGPFIVYPSITTDFTLGAELTLHYTFGSMLNFANPVRVIGSLELLGSPGTLARTVGTGLKDLVVYPYEGILNGPVGFVSGLGYGVSSLLKSVSSGTLVSVTNWAQSVSRNIDRLTADEQEKFIADAAKQVELQGITDGVVQGLSGFGIRMLGAIGGISQHPINSLIHQGPSATGVIGGVGRGMIGMVVKPIGGVAELISMTGQGVLLATGWKPRRKTKKSKSRERKAQAVQYSNQ